jgi:hypothetical protein
MYIHLPLIDWVPIIGGPLLAGGLFTAALARAARTARIRSNESRRVITGVVLFLAAWFTAYAYLAGRGVFSGPAPFPTLPIALLLPLIVAFFALKAFPSLRAIVESVPQEHLIGMQTIRLMGFAFLLLLAQSLLPKIFALPAGLGDMFVGLEAIFVARLYARHAGSASTMGLLWNVTGIADFAVALAIGFLASTTPFQLIHVNPSTDLVTVLPLTMVPVFGVPLFLILHALSMSRILSELKVRTRAAPSTV